MIDVFVPDRPTVSLSTLGISVVAALRLSQKPVISRKTWPKLPIASRAKSCLTGASSLPPSASKTSLSSTWRLK